MQTIAWPTFVCVRAILHFFRLALAYKQPATETPTRRNKSMIIPASSPPSPNASPPIATTVARCAPSLRSTITSFPTSGSIAAASTRSLAVRRADRFRGRRFPQAVGSLPAAFFFARALLTRSRISGTSRRPRRRLRGRCGPWSRPRPCRAPWAITSSAISLRDDDDAVDVAEHDVARAYRHARRTTTGSSIVTIFAAALRIERADAAVEHRKAHRPDLAHIAHEAVGDAADRAAGASGRR